MKNLDFRLIHDFQRGFPIAPLPLGYNLDMNAPGREIGDNPFWPLNTMWFWLVAVPASHFWYVSHWQSYVIALGTVSAICPVITGVLRGIRQQNWRFIVAGIACGALWALIALSLFW